MRPRRRGNWRSRSSVGWGPVQVLRLGCRRTLPAFRGKRRVTHPGNFVAFQLPKSLSLASEASSPGSGPGAAAEISQVRSTAAPAGGAAAARRSQTGGNSRVRNLWLPGPAGEEVGAQRVRSGSSQPASSAAPASLGLALLESRAQSAGTPAWVVTRPWPVTSAAQTNFFQQPVMVITVIEAAIYL